MLIIKNTPCLSLLPVPIFSSPKVPTFSSFASSGTSPNICTQYMPPGEIPLVLFLLWAPVQPHSWFSPLPFWECPFPVTFVRSLVSWIIFLSLSWISPYCLAR